MKKTKILSVISTVALSLGTMIPVYAEDYSDEDAWYARCSQPQTDQAGVSACQGFQNYQEQKRQQLQENINSFNNDIASLKSDSAEIEALAKQQKETRRAA